MEPQPNQINHAFLNQTPLLIDDSTEESSPITASVPKASTKRVIKSGSKSGRKPSPVWEYFTETKDGNYYYYYYNFSHFFLDLICSLIITGYSCKHCKDNKKGHYSNSTATSNLINHMLKTHHVNVDGCESDLKQKKLVSVYFTCLFFFSSRI
jgi:hypothetical protein